MFLGHYSIIKGLAIIFVLFGVASSLAYWKTEQTVRNAIANNNNVVRSRWTNRTLSYVILRYPGDITIGDCESEIRLAFDLWSQHANLTFTQIRTTEPVHIEIKFVPLEAFLSRAKAPMYGGDIQFDSYRYWSTDVENGIQLSRVAAYEIGISLGLVDSPNSSSIMYPVYRPTGPLQLSAEDIENIQKVYGKKTIGSECICKD